MEDFHEWLQKLKYKADITEVIGSYVNIVRKGTSDWCCCPFHREKTPSFKIYTENQNYHCYGCGATGDVFSFVMQMESQDFMGAVKLLAEKYGMQMPQFNFQEGSDKSRAQKDRLYQLMRELARHYHENLNSKKGVKAAAYLQNRGVDKQTIIKFGIGFAAGDDALNFLEQKGYTKQEMELAGVAESKNGRWRDTLANRLIVPIIDTLSHVIAFGGRELEDSGFAKYKNTKETILFKKSKELFAANILKKVKQQVGLESVIIVEGYMDVIALNQAGIDNVVASMGTALTEEQAKILSRYCNKIYICYDGDSAGQKATTRGLKILKDAGLSVKVMSLIEGLDPDEVIKKYGVDMFRSLQKSALPLTEYRIRSLAKELNNDDADERVKFSLKAIEFLKEADTVLERELYLPLVSEISGLSVGVLQRQLYGDSVSIKEKKPIEKPATKQTRKENAYYKAARFVLYGLFANSSFADVIEDLSPFFSDEAHCMLYDIYRSASCQGEVSLGLVEQQLEFNAEAEKVLEAAKEAQFCDAEQYFNESLQYLKKKFARRAKIDLSEEVDSEQDLEKKQQLKLKIGEILN